MEQVLSPYFREQRVTGLSHNDAKKGINEFLDKGVEDKRIADYIRAVLFTPRPGQEEDWFLAEGVEMPLEERKDQILEWLVNGEFTVDMPWHLHKDDGVVIKAERDQASRMNRLEMWDRVKRVLFALESVDNAANELTDKTRIEEREKYKTFLDAFGIPTEKNAFGASNPDPGLMSEFVRAQRRLMQLNNPHATKMTGPNPSQQLIGPLQTQSHNIFGRKKLALQHLPELSRDRLQLLQQLRDWSQVEQTPSRSSYNTNAPFEKDSAATSFYKTLSDTFIGGGETAVSDWYRDLPSQVVGLEKAMKGQESPDIASVPSNEFMSRYGKRWEHETRSWSEVYLDTIAKIKTAEYDWRFAGQTGLEMLTQRDTLNARLSNPYNNLNSFTRKPNPGVFGFLTSVQDHTLFYHFGDDPNVQKVLQYEAEMDALIEKTYKENPLANLRFETTEKDERTSFLDEKRGPFVRPGKTTTHGIATSMEDSPSITAANLKALQQEHPELETEEQVREWREKQMFGGTGEQEHLKRDPKARHELRRPNPKVVEGHKVAAEQRDAKYEAKEKAHWEDTNPLMDPASRAPIKLWRWLTK